MKYAHVVSYVGSTLWAMEAGKLAELLNVLAFRAAGGEFTADEIQARIGDRGKGAALSFGGDVGVVPLRGTIAHRMGGMEDSSGGASAERFTALVNAAAADPSIGTILLDVDSPGGTIPGVPEAADAVFAARQKKPVIAVANSMMASAAYWIASQATQIVAIPSALEGKIGSIGAYFVHQDLSAALEKEGVKVTLIAAGAHKVDGNPFEPLSAARHAELQAMADETRRQFAATVARGRGVTVAQVLDGFGEGRALTAVDALAAGMIDRITPMADLIGELVGTSSSRSMRAEETEPALVASDEDRRMSLL